MLGTTRYICDECLFVPKFAILDAKGHEAYRLRPDVCCAGCCVRCVCGQRGGRCW